MNLGSPKDKATTLHNLMKSSVMVQQRKTNFTHRELDTLLSSVEKRRRIILRGASAGQEKWASAWREVAREVSAIEGIRRTDADVRKKWTYLKWEAKNTSKPYRDFTSRAVLNILTKGNRQDSRSSTHLIREIMSAPQQQLMSAPSSSGFVPSPSLSASGVVKPVVKPTAAVTPPPSVKSKASTPVLIAPAPPPPQDDDGGICVRWNTYATNMSSAMPSLLEDEKFVDVTLACDGRYIKCHKVILGACSAYFEELLSVNPCQHPIILMKDFQFWEIQTVVDFIYRGVVNIPQHKLPKLLQVANILQIKGLAGARTEGGSKEDEIIDTAEPPTEPAECPNKPQFKSTSNPYTSLVSATKTSGEARKRTRLVLKCNEEELLEPHGSDQVMLQCIEPSASSVKEPLPKIAKRSSTRRGVSELQSASQSSQPSVSLEPPTLMPVISIKEESVDLYVDNSSPGSYQDNQQMAKDSSSHPAQFESLTLLRRGVSELQSASQSSQPSVSLEPPTLMPLISIKEESVDLYIDNSSPGSYHDNQQMAEDSSSHPAQFESLTVLSSASIKQELTEELFDPACEEDPLKSQSENMTNS